MYVLEKMRSLFYRYYQRKDGNFSILAAVSMLTIVTFVGAAYDISRLQSAKLIAQDAADSMALSASIAVDRENQDRFLEDESYSYADLGGPHEDFTGTMTGNIDYNPTNSGGGVYFCPSNSYWNISTRFYGHSRC